MSDLTGPGRNSEMSTIEVVEGLGPELADQLALPRRLDLEAAEGVGRPDQLEGRRVVVRHAGRRRRWLDARRRRPGATSADGVRHRRLHPDAEDVELEQPEVLDVVLVELAHREAEAARLDRGAVEQARVGQEHAARVQRDVAGQPVEASRRGRRTCRARSSAAPRPLARSSGRSRRAARASRARMCGNALAIASTSPGGMPSAAPTSRTAWRTR